MVNRVLGNSYTSGDWKDLLTEYNGGLIVYEGQTYDADTNTVSGTVTGGNPISYYNGTRWEMSWEHGRQLGTAQSSTSTTDTTLGYDYDADGIRTSKTYTVNTYAEASNGQHTVTFKADNNTVATITVNDGYVLQDSDYPTVPPKTLYIGTWDKYTAPIHENITITAVYTRIIIKPDPIVPDPIIPSPVSIETASVPDREGQQLLSTSTVQHDYITQNGKVVRETVTTDGTVTAVMDFIYDESGRPFALSYTNGTSTPDVYYYVLNLQGDVVGLVDSDAEWVAQYTYNAWGEILSVTDEDDEAITSPSHIANINPLRYRGYYYDTETGFYYLQSRYYDPITHRFINADSYTSTGQGILGTNMFAYCLNAPVVLCDSSGTWGEITLDWIRAIVDSFDDAISSLGQIATVYVVVCVVVIVVLSVAYGISCVIESAESNDTETSEQEEQTEPNVTYPGDNPSVSPGEDYEWRGQQPVGGDKGAWVNGKTGEQWHPDLNHKPPKGPHWDYKDPNGTWWRVFENGQVELK